MTSRWQAEKMAVVEAAQAMARKGLVVGAAGNVSVRLGADEELLAITPSRTPYDLLDADAIQVIDFEGDPIEGEGIPSIESLMHIAAYRVRPNIGAVVHTHSVYASVLAVAHRELPPVIDEMVTSIGGEVPVAPYAFPSTEELAEGVGKALGHRNAVILANHGMVGVGQDLRSALTNCELVERAAQVYVLASLLGSVNRLPDDVVEAEKEIFTMMHLNTNI